VVGAAMKVAARCAKENPREDEAQEGIERDVA
jgi:hypothetical protein